MQELDSILQKYTIPSPNRLKGAVFIAVDKDGETIYSRAYGSRKTDAGEHSPLETSSVFWMASMSKLMTAIASMIAVEKGLIKLDTNVREVVPELADLDVLVGFKDSETEKGDNGTAALKVPILKKAENPMTLRQLLSHSSGFTYDSTHEGLKQWKAFHGRTDNTFTGSYKGYHHPLVFEPGEGWSYGPGMDWAGRTIEVLTGQSLEEFMKENIWFKLGMNDTTFRPELRPDFPARRMEVGWRDKSTGYLAGGKVPLANPAEDCLGGVGLYSTPEDYAKLLTALLMGGAPILKSSSLNEILSPQLRDNKDFLSIVCGSRRSHLGQTWPIGMTGTFGLSSSINLEDFPHGRAKNSVNWSGMPGIHAWIDRETGIAATLFTQILPPGDPIVTECLAELETSLYNGRRSPSTSSASSTNGVSSMTSLEDLPSSDLSASIVKTSSRILIIGAGLGGLALAQGLKKAGIPFHVFERDPTPDFRPQGYRIKLNGDGATVLKNTISAELWEYFERTCCHARLGETNFNAVDGSITASRRGGGPGRPGPAPHTADRTVLRKILLTGLEENISYGKEFSRYIVTPTGVIVQFSDGSSEEGALLVGADGVRSAVRMQYLPDHKPVDTDGRCIYGKTPLTAELIDRFPAKAMRWMTLIVDKTPWTQTLDVDDTPLTLLLEPIRFQDNELRSELPQDYVYWVLISRKSTFGATDEELLKMSGKESAQLSLDMTEVWDPSLRSLLELQDVSQSSALRVGSAKPDMPAWRPSERVTLLGDAIHVMSPAGGVGAVTALRDAFTLSKVLAEGGISATSIGKYEEAMRGYAQKAIERSYFGGKKLFAQRPFAQCEPLKL